jgi:hypothetical protein
MVWKVVAVVGAVALAVAFVAGVSQAQINVFVEIAMALGGLIANLFGIFKAKA